MNLQFRAELFNLLNHTSYSTPDNGVQDAQFGQILSAARSLSGESLDSV